MVLIVVLYLVVLTFACVDEILKCDHSNESCWAVLSILLYNVVPTFESVDEILWCDHWKETSALFGSTFTWCYLLFSSLQNKIDKLCYILSRYTGFTIPVYYMFENESIGQLWRRVKRFFRHLGALLTFSPHLHWTKAMWVVLARIWFCYIPWKFSTSILEIRPETREGLTVYS